MNIVAIYRLFPTERDCIQKLESVRWPDGPVCPYCESKRHTRRPDGKNIHCNGCNTDYTVTVGTIFHRTLLDLQKWFLAITLVLNAKKGISARQLARDIEVNKDTAWRMLMQLRIAMEQSPELLTGIIEVDETYIGGVDKNRHKDKRKGGRGRGTGKTTVLGLRQRGGVTRARKSPDAGGESIMEFLRANIAEGAVIMSDTWTGYKHLKKYFKHETVNHKEDEFVRGAVHTNTIEAFWTLIKRGIMGQYHHVTDRYLNEYVKEFCFRQDNRENPDAFGTLLRRAVTVSAKPGHPIPVC